MATKRGKKSNIVEPKNGLSDVQQVYIHVRKDELTPAKIAKAIGVTAAVVKAYLKEYNAPAKELKEVEATPEPLPTGIVGKEKGASLFTKQASERADSQRKNFDKDGYLKKNTSKIHQIKKK